MLWFCDKNAGLDRLSDALGLIPDFLSEDDPRPARDQLNTNYAHGGGWHPAPGFTLCDGRLCYEGDPPLDPIAFSDLRGERIIVYPYAWVVIQQRDGAFEVSRLD